MRNQISIEPYSNVATVGANFPGLWIPQGDESCSFSSDMATAHDDIAEFTIRVPKNMEAAGQSFKQLSADLRTTRESVSKACESLGTMSPVSGVSFEADAQSDSPECALQRHLAKLIHSPSFSFSTEDPAEDSSLGAEFQAYLKQIIQFLKPTLYVESRMEDGVIARTRIAFNGDIETVWQRPIIPEHADIHYTLLSHTLESRAAVLQLLGQIVSGGAALAARFCLPGGAVTVIPAVWRYVRDVMKQAKHVTSTLTCSQHAQLTT